MNIIYKLRNYKLKYREKFSNAYYRQMFRLGHIMLRHPVIAMKQGILKVMFGLTYRCQCNCIYCCVGQCSKSVSNELNTNEIRNLLSQVASLPSLGTLVSFFGGEPLIRDDIYELVKHSTMNGLFVEIESNGILLSRNNALKLKKVGVHHIFIRLESSTYKTHDYLSGYEGCFKKAVVAIKGCLRARISCSISTIATKEKIHTNELKEIIRLGKLLGVTSIRILYPTLSGNWLHSTNELLDEAEQGYVRSLLEPDFIYLESTYSADNDTRRFCPSLDKKFFYVSPYGEVQLCPFVPINFGEIRNDTLTNIVGKMWKDKFSSKSYADGCPMNQMDLRKELLCKGELLKEAASMRKI